MSVTRTAGLAAPVPSRHAGEKDKASDKTENECEIVMNDKIRKKDGGNIDCRGN